jgi:ABC-type multidrug transport system fused ATPase/permease subunit
MAVIVIGAFLDVFGLAMILPVLSIAIDPTIIEKNFYLSLVYEWSGYSEVSHFLIFLVVSLLALFIVKNVISFFIHYIQARYSSNVATYLAEKQYRKYFTTNWAFIKSQKSSLIVTNITNIPSFFSTGVLMPSIVTVSETFVILFIVTGLAVYDVQLFLVLGLILGPTFMVLYRATKNKMYQVGLERKKYQPQAYGQVNQSIFGYTDVKLFGKESHFLKKFIFPQSKMNRLSAIGYIMHFLPARVVEVVAVMGVVIIFVYTLAFAQQQEALLMFISLFVAAAYRVMPSLNKILIAIMNIKANQYTLGILKEEYESDQEGWGTAPQPMQFQNSIELKEVRFRFADGEEDALRDINLTIKRGDVVGFYGRSGSGKSTLMRVILRFLKESAGGLYVDGKQITSENLHAWRALLGYVKQDPFILDRSLRENIAFGVSPDEIDDSKLMQAIQASALDKVVADLPEGVETQLGEFGNRFSGGQKQRIEIARALYRNAEVLVLDEATSALDSTTEREIVESILSLAEAGKTILTIAHRITTLQGCTTIYEIDHGRIVGQMSYDELVAREGASE